MTNAIKRIDALRFYRKMESDLKNNFDPTNCLHTISRIWGKDTATDVGVETGIFAQLDDSLARELRDRNISGAPEPVRLYCALFHGRKDPHDPPDDWGTEGPVLGSFTYCHATYGQIRCLGYTNTAGHSKEWEIADSTVNGLVYYDGVFYGDMSIVVDTELENVSIFNRSKATLPHPHGNSK